MSVRGIKGFNKYRILNISDVVAQRRILFSCAVLLINRQECPIIYTQFICRIEWDIILDEEQSMIMIHRVQ